jgi:hypothetical protein
MFLERVEAALEQVKSVGHSLVWYNPSKPFRGYMLARHDKCVSITHDTTATELLDAIRGIDGYNGYDAIFMVSNEDEGVIYVHPVSKVRNFYKALDAARGTVTKSFIHVVDNKPVCICEAV